MSGIRRQLHGRGRCLAAEALEATHAATTVRLRNEEPVVTDGPFAETKKLLAGFYLLEARELNEAIQLTSKNPPLSVGRAELRRVFETGVDP